MCAWPLVLYVNPLAKRTSSLFEAVKSPGKDSAGSFFQGQLPIGHVDLLFSHAFLGRSC